MNQNLINIFEAFKASDYYQENPTTINLDWLKNKISSNDFQSLEEQIYCLLLDTEEEIFINTLKYLWKISRELSTNDIQYLDK